MSIIIIVFLSLIAIYITFVLVGVIVKINRIQIISSEGKSKEISTKYAKLINQIDKNHETLQNTLLIIDEIKTQKTPKRRTVVANK